MRIFLIVKGNKVVYAGFNRSDVKQEQNRHYCGTSSFREIRVNASSINSLNGSDRIATCINGHEISYNDIYRAFVKK